MLDIKVIRANPEMVKENMRKKFQDERVPLVDEVIALDKELREIQTEGDQLRSKRNTTSKEIGKLMGAGKRDEAEVIKDEVRNIGERLTQLEADLVEKQARYKEIMFTIPNIMDDSVPIGKDDTENVVIETHGDISAKDFEVPYHADIMTNLGGLDLESARKTSGSGFYYLLGDVARIHSAVISYAREFMIAKGFTYVIPPYMIREEVVSGVMSFEEMDNMMYKIEGEDLYLIGTSEHSTIGRYMDSITDKDQLPQTLTSFSPCFRKEVGAHGIEERGVYRVHQFEKQEMVVLCDPKDSKEWFDKLYKYSVELFLSLDIPVQVIECCSGDLADLKVKSVDVEAWSPRQGKYFEVCSASNLGEAQARRLKIRVAGEEGNYYPHTLNNTVVAPPRMLIAFFENNVNADGSVNIPEALRPFMGGQTIINPK
ncbi:MAG: serine--tRNA ligase [Erysipelothrix sp.]|nr:serine--tRNA ligase [Erysipelothrix sp.]